MSLKITSVSRGFSRKISVNYHSIDFSAMVTATPDKPEMTFEEYSVFSEKVYAAAKLAVESDMESEETKKMILDMKNNRLNGKAI